MNEKVIAVFATDDNYVYFTQVALMSVVRHISSERQYEFVILSEKLSEISLKALANAVTGYSNVTVSFADVSGFIAGLNNGGKEYSIPLRRQVYYRLFIPQLLPTEPKAMYLDSDILVREDIGKLFDYPLNGHDLGAVPDPGFIKGTKIYLSDGRDLKASDYCRDILKLRNWQNYFNAGIVVMNLAGMRQNRIVEQCIDMIDSGRDFYFHDQDMLNLLYDGNYCQLPENWNAMWLNFKRSDSAALIHFAGLPPWLSMSGIRISESRVLDTSEWWNMAKQSPDYEKIQLSSIPDREKYVDRLSEALYQINSSTCWKLTAPLRWLLNKLRR